MKKDGVKQNIQLSFSPSLPFHVAHSGVKLEAWKQKQRRTSRFLKFGLSYDCKKKTTAGDLPITRPTEEGLATSDIKAVLHPLFISASPNMCTCQEISGLEGTGFPQASWLPTQALPKPFPPTHQLTQTHGLARATVSKRAHVQAPACIPHISLTLTIAENQLLFQTTHSLH